MHATQAARARLYEQPIISLSPS